MKTTKKYRSLMNQFIEILKNYNFEQFVTLINSRNLSSDMVQEIFEGFLHQEDEIMRLSINSSTYKIEKSICKNKALITAMFLCFYRQTLWELINEYKWTIYYLLTYNKNLEKIIQYSKQLLLNYNIDTIKSVIHKHQSYITKLSLVSKSIFYILTGQTQIQSVIKRCHLSWREKFIQLIRVYSIPKNILVTTDIPNNALNENPGGLTIEIWHKIAESGVDTPLKPIVLQREILESTKSELTKPELEVNNLRFLDVKALYPEVFNDENTDVRSSIDESFSCSKEIIILKNFISCSIKL